MSPKALLPTAAALLAPVPLVLGAAGWRGNVRGWLPDGLSAAARESWVFQNGWPVAGCLALVVAGVGLFAYGVWGLRAAAAAESGSEASADPAAPAWLPELTQAQNAAIAAGAIAGMLVLAFVGRDLAWHVGQPPGSERLIHLFVYNYNRPWPEHLDYRPILFGFGLIASAFTLLIGLRRLRGAAALSLIGAALAFTVFILDVYMVDLSPHWSQRELVARYYANRKGPEEPLIAYQMNWKGENYYTGNRVHVFVELDNKKLLEWVDKNKGRTVYAVLEHGRLDRFKRILPGRDVKALTTPRDCNKFVLVKLTL